MNAPAEDLAVAVDLIAVLVTVTDGEPKVLAMPDGTALPAGPFQPGHRSLQTGLRAWVEARTHHPLGYLEQLYTFADSDRADPAADGRSIAISYLGLTREGRRDGAPERGWHAWYDYFPWEDHRAARPALIDGLIAPRLQAWAQTAADAGLRAERQRRAHWTFGLADEGWDEELVLQRYELIYEAGLVVEASPDDRVSASFGRSMASDHRRILATAMARLRAKIKYRPVVFELMPPAFTLLQLQRSVEALSGRRIHKQNFRRLIEMQDLVEETGAIAAATGGRPAKLFRFRRDVLQARALSGTKLPLARA